jgi:hypothetical protein
LKFIGQKDGGESFKKFLNGWLSLDAIQAILNHIKN